MNQIKAIQHDTFDAISYRYNVDLIALIEANQHISMVVLEQHHTINLPNKKTATVVASQTLKLWD